MSDAYNELLSDSWIIYTQYVVVKKSLKKLSSDFKLLKFEAKSLDMKKKSLSMKTTSLRLISVGQQKEPTKIMQEEINKAQ